MRRIAVIGAGQTGATAALVFRQQGHDVTLYSDRSVQSIVDDTPATGTAHVFAEAVALERAWGLHTYEAEAPVPRGYSFCISPEPGAEHIVFGASLGPHTGRAVDTRLISADRIAGFQAAGGAFVIADVTLDGLDELAAGYDCTFVSTGKGGLSSLFPRDPVRSDLDVPARHLLMITVTGIGMDAFSYRTVAPSDEGATCSIANLTGGGGEMFWTPYLHKTAGPSWNLFVEAVPGGPWDRNRNITSAAAARSAIVDLVEVYAPWDAKVIGQTEVIADDRHSWLAGEILSTVRAGWARTASGHLLMALGDTAVTYDPIAGQGANSGLKQVDAYAVALAESGGDGLDDGWAESAWESFYARTVAPAMRLTNLYLRPYPEALGVVVSGCCADPRVGQALVRLFSEPSWRWPFDDPGAARDFIAEATGADPTTVIARGEALTEAAAALSATGAAVFPRP